MIITPIAITTIDWRAFMSFVECVTSVNPSRGIDAAGIDPRSPHGQLASMNMLNDPRTLKKDSRIRDHFHITIGVQTNKQLLTIKFATCMRTYVYEVNSEFLCLMTGTFNEWTRYVVDYCTKSATKDERKLANYMYTLLTDQFYVFTAKKKVDLADGTFILC